MNNENKEKEIIRVIEKIRPYIQKDGGDIEFISLVDDVVYVKVHGACVGCGLINSTLKDGVEALIKDEIENIKSVELYNEEISTL